MDVQSCCFSNLNTLFFAILVAIAVVVAYAPCYYQRKDLRII